MGGLHVLVNNAGVGSTASVEDCTLEEWRRIHAIDLDGVFLGCKLGLPLVARTVGGGRRTRQHPQYFVDRRRDRGGQHGGV